MKSFSRMVLAFITMCVLHGTTVPLHAQLENTFRNIFNEFLIKRLQLSSSPGVHKDHFIESAGEADILLTPALNNLITNNISSFPLSSTTAGVSFDFSSGVPVKVSESLGPIFSENGETIGKGRMTMGLNYTSLSLAKIRGVDLENMRFTFTHKDVDSNGILGGKTDLTEVDVMDVYMGTKIQTSLVILSSTIGLADNLDVGIAIPIIHVGISGTARAVISSYTFSRLGTGLHYFGGDDTHPILESTQSYDVNTTGIGDIALRLKYGVVRNSGTRAAFLIDARIPTGKQEDFLGKGKTSVRLSGILSKRFDDFTPHLNIGYERNAADFISDKLTFIGGFDQKISLGLTFAFDLLADLDLNKDKTVKLYPGSRSVVDVSSTDTSGLSVRKIELSNIPDRDNDNLFNLSTGIRAAISENLIMLANILVPLNDAGLRSSFVLTVGLGINF